MAVRSVRAEVTVIKFTENSLHQQLHSGDAVRAYCMQTNAGRHAWRPS